MNERARTMDIPDTGFWQGARYRSGQTAGHYESWFLRANHPQRNEAFWIRYTVFSPQGRPDDAIGELWVIHSNGETHQIRAAKQEVPIGACRFAAHGLDVQIGSATLQSGRLVGAAAQPHAIAWDLHYRGGDAPMLFLPPGLYSTSLPKAKAVAQRPHVVFSGSITVDGEVMVVDDWVGRWGKETILHWRTDRARQVAYALRSYSAAQISGDVQHDGDPVLARHLANARRRPSKVTDDDGRPMWTISKEYRGSTNLIDAAMAGTISWEARGDAIAAGALRKVRRGGGSI